MIFNKNAILNTYNISSAFILAFLHKTKHIDILSKRILKIFYTVDYEYWNSLSLKIIIK